MSPSRIEELRRRVQNDPASIAFAQLAEEYRRSGQTDEAVRVCREGLTRHPGYLSARVTLGRALLDLGELAEAQGELEFVVAEAPENLAAVRGLAEIFQRGGNFPDALTYYRRALTLARHDPEIEEIVQQLSRQVGVAAAGASTGLSFEEAHRELLSAAERVPVAPPAPPRSVAPAGPAGAPGATAPFDFDRLVAALGAPVAPAQIDAMVQGHAPAGVPELPPAPDDPANPFAALEAELRAQDAAAGAPASMPQVEGLDPSWPSEADPSSPAPALHLVGPAALDAGPDPVALGPAGLGEPGAHAPASEPATIAQDWTGLVAVGAPADLAPAVTESGDGKVPAPGPAGQDQEDVLGDLESWLDTLHDRTTP